MFFGDDKTVPFPFQSPDLFWLCQFYFNNSIHFPQLKLKWHVFRVYSGSFNFKLYKISCYWLNRIIMAIKEGFLFNLFRNFIPQFFFPSRKYAMETLLQIYPEDILSSVRSPEFLEKFSREEYQFGIFGLISSRITEYTKNCRWLNEKIPCNANFRPIITEEGKCFSFVSSRRISSFKSHRFLFDAFIILIFLLENFQNLLSSNEIFTHR